MPALVTGSPVGTHTTSDRTSQRGGDDEPVNILRISAFLFFGHMGSRSPLHHYRCRHKHTGTAYQSTCAAWRVQSLAGCSMNMALRNRPPDDTTRVFADHSSFSTMRHLRLDFMN